MELSHYHSKPFELDREFTYTQRVGTKPSGLWVSVDGEFDWPTWCKAEDFDTTGNTVRHKVVLKPDANIWILSEPEHLLRVPTLGLDGTTLKFHFHVPWPRIAEDFQGIIISPYQWSMRLRDDTFWYYGWDCASGCIWDLSAIEKMEVMDEARNL